jgi:hypothetical protein
MQNEKCRMKNKRRRRQSGQRSFILHFSCFILHFAESRFAMSVGSLGIAGGLAGSPLAQKTGVAVDRAKQDTAHAQRQTEATQRTAEAAGIGQTHEEHEASERDADGRMPWERQEQSDEASVAADEDQSTAGDASQNPSGVRDPKGESGGQIDLVG